MVRAASMLEVCCVAVMHHCEDTYARNLLCVKLNYTLVIIYNLQITTAQECSHFSKNSLFVRVKYACKMATSLTSLHLTVQV